MQQRRSDHLIASDAVPPVTVDFVEELGAGRLVHERLHGQSSTCALAAGQEIPDELRLHAYPAILHLFDPDTGSRLE